MWKIIFQNLWSRRKKNGWIFAELVIVTMILWVLLDVSAVYLYNKSLPLGYDADRLCQVFLYSYSENDPMFQEEYATAEACNENMERIMRKVRGYEGVENATYIFTSWQYLGTSGNQTYSFQSGDMAVDSLVNQIDVLRFHAGTNYFETYGMETVEGSPSPEELSKLNFAWNDVVITADMARRFFGDEKKAVGKKLFFRNWNKDTIWCPVKAVLKDVHYQSYRPTYSLAFRPLTTPELYNYAVVVVRVKDGVDMGKFLEGFGEFANKELSVGNYYAQRVDSMENLNKANERDFFTVNNIAVILTLFFLINLCLGVVGTFWLQTRSRVEEMGVLRTFGATKWNIRIMLLGEGLVLSTLAVIVGCVLYLQIALRTSFVGTSVGMFYDEGLNLIDNWILHFGEHFMIVSLLCYVVITITVLIGIYIPARSISNVNPIEALRVDS